MTIRSSVHYLGNKKLKRAGIKLTMTQAQVDEYIRCANEPEYFIEKYVNIITLDKGFQKITLYDWQRKSIDKINNNRMVIIKAGRQIGKTTGIVGYILWYVLFNDAKAVAILANKAKTAREILNRIKIAYVELPQWIQQGVLEWNKGDIGLENQSRIMADSTASTVIRGYAFNLLYLDEFGFVPNNIAE